MLRTKKFVLWAGAGLSRYAGYPVGGEIAKFLNAQLGDDALPAGSNLVDVSSVYEKISGREKLVASIQNRFFAKAPANFKYHSLLATIPHFKLIITTNFDPLFELAYKGNLVTISSARDFSKMDGLTPTLIKLHGDFSEREEMVLTREDYAKYMNRTPGSIFGDFIKVSVAREHVLFIGYAWEDFNTLTLFNEISEALADHRKEWFLVSPGLKDFQTRDFKKKNITVINSTGELFIEELQKNINRNIVADFHTRSLDPNIFDEYLSHRDLIPRMELGPNRQLISLHVAGGKVPASTLRLSAGKEIMDQVNKLRTGQEFGRIEIKSEDLKDFALEVNDITVLQYEKDLSIIISSHADTTEKADVIFGSERLHDATLQTFNLPNCFGFKVAYHNFSITSTFSKDAEKTGEKTKAELLPEFSKASHGLAIAKFVQHVSEGKPASIARDTKPIPMKLKPDPHYQQQAKAMVEHFECLKLIEDYYGISIQNFAITDADVEEARHIANCIRGYFANMEYVTATVVREEVDMPLLRELQEKHPPVQIQMFNGAPAKLYGRELSLNGLTMEVFDANIANADEFFNGNANKINIESLSGKIKMQLPERSAGEA